MIVGLVYGLRLCGSYEYRYAGLTTKTEIIRLRKHLQNARSGKRTPLCDWLRKHGEDVVVDVLEYVRADLSALGEAEVDWIAYLRAMGHRLLNLAEGGLGPTGVVWTDEQREAARKRSTGRKGVSRFGDTNPFYGRRHTDEQRARWSERRTGTMSGTDNPNFGRFGADHPAFGRVMSQEARDALSEARKGAGNPNFGRSASPETRAKRSAAQKGVPRPSSARSAHTRHHTNKGRTSPACRFCVEESSTPSAPSEGEVQE